MIESETLRSPLELSKLAERLAKVSKIGLDFETASFNGRPESALEHDKLEVVGVGMAFPDGYSCYVPMMHSVGKNANPDQIRGILQKIGSNKELEVWAHNIKFEQTVFRTLRIEPEFKSRDTMIAQWLLGKKLPGAKGLKLKAAVKEFLNYTMTTWEEVMSGNSKAFYVPIDTMTKYCGDDALQCLRLSRKFLPELEDYQLGKVFTDLEIPFVPVLVHMKEVGFALDKDYLDDLHSGFVEERDEIRRQFVEKYRVSISSSQAVSKKMYEELKLWPCQGFKRGTSGFYSVDAGHLERVESRLEVGSEGHRALLWKSRFQKLEKLAGTYTKPLVEQAENYNDKRLRGDFHQTGTDTGRLASSNPNLQNIPTRSEEGNNIRNAFVAEEGWTLGVSDYSQADLVMMAHLSMDTMLTKAYTEKLDLHQLTANNCKCDRSTGKVINLGLIYEMGVNTLAGNLKIDSTEAFRLWTAWHRAYPMVRQYHKRMHAFAEKHGYVRTITGRIRLIPDIHSDDSYKRTLSQHMASNTPDQGSVADFIKIAMRNLFNEWKSRGVLYDYYTKEGKAKILSQVHDELICELRDDFAEEAADDIQRHMEKAVELRVPMTAIPGIGKNWNLAKKDGKRRESEAAKK